MYVPPAAERELAPALPLDGAGVADDPAAAVASKGVAPANKHGSVQSKHMIITEVTRINFDRHRDVNNMAM